MKRIALDTNAYSALGAGNQDIAAMVQAAQSVGLPIVVMGELYFGIYNGKKQSENHARLERFIGVDRVEILQCNEQTAQIFGEIATELKTIGKPIQQNDIWIAALCKQYGYSLVTQDSGFDNIVGLHTIPFA